MTVRETIIFIRSLLDDGLDWFNTAPHVVDVINEAQLRMIDYWVATNNERALRPLFKLDQYVPDYRNNSTTPEPIEAYQQVGLTLIRRKPLYVRGCLVSLNELASPNSINFTLHANYMPPELFLNNEGTLTSYVLNGTFTQVSMPHNLYYTIQRDVDILGEWQDFLMFTMGATLFEARAMVTFIANPLPFSATQELEVAPEYHYEVCTLAAEILNGNDVGERNRSKVAVAEFGQKLDILTLGQSDA